MAVTQMDGTTGRDSEFTSFSFFFLFVSLFFSYFGAAFYGRMVQDLQKIANEQSVSYLW